MLVFEFNALTSHGIIPIPKEYQDKVPENVKVILEIEEENEDDDLNFPDVQIDTLKFKFNREEANER